MSNTPKDDRPNPHEVVVTIVDAAHKLRRHDGQFLVAVLLLEQAIAEIYRSLGPML